MKEKHYFPFGSELKKVEQKDKTPKKAFVLGVYASAVHARWIGKNGENIVSALAVASEPEIFWKGQNAGEIISRISLPEELGELLVPTNRNLNGPSGRALDDLFLKPLDIERSDSWLCDLIPESRINEKQKKALENNYTKEIIKQFSLNPVSIRDFDKAELNSTTRREEILNELVESKADTIVLLGDLPIYWFLRFYDKRFRKLSDFGESQETYGKPRNVKIKGKDYNVIALCHPRQAARLGISSKKWGELHDNWIIKKKKLHV